MTTLNRQVGGIFITAGTCIGAGMLALPISAVSIGFIGSLILLFIMWIIMVFAAFVSVDINIKLKENASVAKLSRKFLGQFFHILSLLSLFTLFYALLSAYITGSSSILSSELKTYFNMLLSPKMISLGLTLVIGGFILTKLKAVDYTNRVLFFIKILLFFAMIFLFIPEIKLSLLFDAKKELDISILTAILVFFTSFGFHGSIPVIMKYVGPDPKTLKRVFFIGTLIPFLVYVLWLFASQGVLPREGQYSFSNVLKAQGDAGSFVENLNGVIKSNHLNLFVSWFSLLAMLTSLIGVAIGMYDYILEFFKEISLKTKLLCVTLTLTLPLLFSLLYPQGFIFALSLSAIFLSILAILIPSMVAIKKYSFVYNDKKNHKIRITSLYLAFIVSILIVLVKPFLFFYMK